MASVPISLEESSNCNEQKSMSNHQAIKVAVVDDDASLCRAVKRLLSAAGIGCECFLSAEEFLE